MKINLKAENPISPSRTLGEKVNSECTTRPMTPEEWAYYGPRNPAQRNKSHYMSSKKGAKKNAKQVRGEKDAS
jgi:hypothetical protein